MKFLVLHVVSQLLIEAKIVEYQNNLPDLPQLPAITPHVEHAGKMLKNAGSWLRNMMPISDNESIGLRRIPGRGGISIYICDNISKILYYIW